MQYRCKSCGKFGQKLSKLSRSLECKSYCNKVQKSAAAYIAILNLSINRRIIQKIVDNIKRKITCKTT